MEIHTEKAAAFLPLNLEGSLNLSLQDHGKGKKIQEWNTEILTH